MGNIMSGHIAHYPSAMDYFTDHGMPPIARQRLESWVNQPYYMGVSLFTAPDTKEWFAQNCRGLYTKYLITHPGYALSPFSISLHKPNNIKNTIHAIFYPTQQYVLIYSSIKIKFVFKHLPKLTFYFKPYFAHPILFKILTLTSKIYYFIIPILFVLLIALSIKYRKYLYSPSMFSIFYYLLLSVPVFLFIWHADAGGPERHQLVTYLNITLMLFLGLAFLLNPISVRVNQNNEAP